MPDPRYPDFQNRWRITGELVAVSALHVGDGFASTERLRRPGGAGMAGRRPGSDPAKGEEQPQVQTVCCVPGGKPFIPASTLKGGLRSWLEARREWDADWAELLGTPADCPEKDARGGALGFWDARLTQPAARGKDSPSPNFWDPGRATDVAVSVSIERRTRTALPHHLFHLEYVPAGSRFEVEITGQNLGEGHIPKLLGLLACLDGQTFALGAHTVHGWGRMRWENPRVFCLERAAVAAWLEATEKGLEQPGFSCPAGFSAVNTEKTSFFPPPASTRTNAADGLSFELRLRFHAPLLVRDPARTRRGKPPPGEEEGAPQAHALRDFANQPYLPARSARGVLRSRAEAILRTLGHAVAPPEKDVVVQSAEDLGGLNPVTGLFGASGWRGALRVENFILKEGRAAEHRQEFIAIDRFHGGGATGLKYNTVAVVSVGHPLEPLVLTGSLAVELDRLALLPGSGSAVRGLLALVLRDLAEGDLAFGSGAAKGYGACKAEASVRDAGTEFASLDAWFASERVQDSLAALRALPLAVPAPTGAPDAHD